MKTSIKRLICTVFCLCLLVGSFSACSGKKTGGNSTPSNGGGNSGNAGNVNVSQVEGVDDFEPYKNIPAECKGQTVRFASWEVLDSYNWAKFEADTGIKAERVEVPQSGYISKIQSMITSGDIPDVFVDNDGTGFPLTLSFAQPINKCSQVDLTDPAWDQSMLATATIDGNVYMLNTHNSPWAGSNLIYYNKALYDELGEKTPAEYYAEGTWTWDTLDQMLKRFKSAGYYGANINAKMFAGSAGASFISYDYKNAKFSNNVDSIALLAAYQTWAEWDRQGLLGATMQSFREGKAAMYALGVFGLKTEGHWSDMDPDDVGFTYFPSMKDGETAKVHSIYRMYGIVAGAPHANAAGYFIRHFLDYKNYDLSTTFISEEAANFYYEITNTPADGKYFTFDDHCGQLTAEAAPFNTAVQKASANDVPTEIQAISNRVDKAVEAANATIAELRNHYK